MLRVKNLVPAISIEGFEEATDFRRGEGTYRKVIEAMTRLKERKLLFGISCCYTSKNVEVIGSEEYFDSMIDMGAKFAWFFTYMPIGAAAVPELIATAEQRKFMYEQIHKFRKTKPLFTMDFWNDGDAVGGCIAGGRGYCHINANGDMEPCAFIHYSDSNIKEKTLLECYQSPLFMAYRRNQPFNDNMLRPCPVLDNPGRSWRNPAPVPRILKAPSAPATTVTAASPPLKSGRRLPMSCGILSPRRRAFSSPERWRKNPDGRQSVWTICWYRIPIPASPAR